jgi:hypothetical protein
MTLIEAAAIVQRYQEFQTRNSLLRDVVESKLHHLSLVGCYLECDTCPILSPSLCFEHVRFTPADSTDQRNTF